MQDVHVKQHSIAGQLYCKPSQDASASKTFPGIYKQEGIRIFTDGIKTIPKSPALDIAVSYLTIRPVTSTANGRGPWQPATGTPGK